MLVLKGIFGGSLKITLQSRKITRKVKNHPKDFLWQFWGRKWLCQFYGAWKTWILSAGTTHAHKVALFRGGGGILCLGGCVLGLGGRGRRVTGTIWQIGVLTAERSVF